VLFRSFVGESGLSAVKLKNIRSKWVGSTEANLEKVLSMVRALGPIILIIDEGDRAFGGTADEDGGTSSRVIARLKEFMSDPDNRGRVLTLLLTNRPDKLDADIKRAGRLDRKIPFFYASAPLEVEAVIQALLGRYGIAAQIEFPRDRTALSEPLVGLSNADLEAVCLLAHDFAGQAGGPVTPEVFAQAIADYLPPRDTRMLEYMELLAVFESSRRSLVPERLRHLTAQELNDRLRALRAELQL
jgi:transitional endoplasmic reticulum ATPase